MLGIFCVYVAYIDKSWFNMEAWVLGICYVAIFLGLFCPESPRWLLYQGRRKEAIAALNHIAKVNCKPRIPEDTRFVEDATGEEYLDIHDDLDYEELQKLKTSGPKMRKMFTMFPGKKDVKTE